MEVHCPESPPLHTRFSAAASSASSSPSRVSTNWMTLTRLRGASLQLSEGLLCCPGSSVGGKESGTCAGLPTSTTHHSRPSHQQPTEAWQGLLRQQVAGKHLFTSLDIILSLEAEHGLCLVLSQPQCFEVEVGERKRQTPQPGGQAGIVSTHRGCRLVPRGQQTLTGSQLHQAHAAQLYGQAQGEGQPGDCLSKRGH